MIKCEKHCSIYGAQEWDGPMCSGGRAADKTNEVPGPMTLLSYKALCSTSP